MRWSTSPLGSLALLSSVITALEITSPAAGAAIDPTQSVVVEWTFDSSDPGVIDLWIDHQDPTGLTYTSTFASGLSTSSGTYTIPPNTIQDFGSGYQIQAREENAGPDGEVVAEVQVTLSPFQNAVSTNSDGRVTVVSQTTAQGPITAPTSLQSATGVTILSGTATPETTATGATRSSGFITSSTSRASGEESAAATSADVANTAAAKIQMRGSEVVLGAAGVLAGIVALLA
jgi:Ser-Thr-rich glycosyl-phosphatidyl-inositol-anchored membrane family